jgi:hypothetical protein
VPRAVFSPLYGAFFVGMRDIPQNVGHGLFSLELNRDFIPFRRPSHHLKAAAAVFSSNIRSISFPIMQYSQVHQNNRNIDLIPIKDCRTRKGK